MSTPTCQYELDFRDHQSHLCGEPAAVLVERRQFGRFHVCEAHLSNELLAQARFEHWVVSKLPVITQNGRKTSENGEI